MIQTDQTVFAECVEFNEILIRFTVVTKLFIVVSGGEYTRNEEEGGVFDR